MERGGGEWRVGRGIQTFYLDAVGDTSMDTLLREWLPLVIVCILPLLCMVGAILFLQIQLIIRAAAPPNPKPMGGRVIVRQMSHGAWANRERAQTSAESATYCRREAPQTRAPHCRFDECVRKCGSWYKQQDCFAGLNGVKPRKARKAPQIVPQSEIKC